MDAPTVTRFAPSPTGRLHLGNLRTALFNALFARARNGQFLLRIEDTDVARGSLDAERALLEDLRWLGLDWDEGPERKGRNGPYRQSERTGVYADSFQRLLAEDRAYPCYCTPEELKLARAAMRAAGKAPRYPGTCAALTAAERDAKQAEGRTASLRFRIPKGRTGLFDDLVRGELRFDTERIGDFVIRRSDGTPAFFFANAVDDARMGVSHVLRGEDHLANTPRQLLLLEALQLPAPRYGHLPLVVAADGRPLSKRRGAPGLDDLRQQGYLPSAILNYLARLGHHYDNDALLAWEALVQDFVPERLGKAPARFDEEQLLYWQKQAVAALDLVAFRAWMGGPARALVPAAKFADFIETVKPNCAYPVNAEHWAQVFFKEIPFYSSPARAAIREAGAEFFTRAAQAAQAEPADAVDAIKRATGVKGKVLFMPLRAALTGKLRGPELARVMTLLGPEKVVARLAKQARENA